MKTRFVLLFTLSLILFVGCAEVMNVIQSPAGVPLTEEEVVRGLKEALSTGARNSAGRLSLENGYYGDPLVKILLPDEAKTIVDNISKIPGGEKLVEDVILRINRAAEDAASGITNIFINAISQMTLSDGLKILQGSDNAATDYLKKTTTAQLTQKMRPVIDSSLAKVNATGYWKDVFTAYNKIPFSGQKVNTDLTAYVTEKALSGIFYSIGQEEQKIRKDPSARVTGLLQKVFTK